MRIVKRSLIDRRSLHAPQCAMFSWNRLHPGVKAVFFVQIVNRMGDFVFPFLTLLMTQVQGFRPVAAGVTVTLAMALESVGSLAAGRFSDTHGRRDTLIVFLLCSGLLLAGAGFAPASRAAAVAMIASGFFIGAMRPSLAALVADLSEAETRRAAFSLSYFGVNLGASVGPLLAGWLFDHALSWMFWLDGLSTAAAVIILIRFVPRRTLPLAQAETRAPSPDGAPAAFVGNRVLFPFALLFLVYDLVYAQMVFTLGLQMIDLFGDRGPQIFGAVWAVNGVTVIVLTPLALHLTKPWSNLSSMAAGMACFAVGTGIFLFKPDLTLVVVSTLAWTTGEVLFSIHAGDLITALSPPEFRGRFQGYVQFLAQLGFVFSPLGGGLAAETLGLAGVWRLATVMVALVSLGFAALDRRVPAPSPRST